MEEPIATMDADLQLGGYRPRTRRTNLQSIVLKFHAEPVQ